MNALEVYKQALSERVDYKNFSEDVEILNENNIDENLSVYTVRNKNNVTFQNVLGMAWIGLGKLGYVNGDRSRPILLGTSDIDIKMKSGRFSSRDNSPGQDQVSTTVTVIMEFTWDIQLEATRGSETVTKTKSSYIRVI